jgi:hypothetical protein
MCPACLTAIVVVGATSGGGLWAFKRIAQEDSDMKEKTTCSGA